jgi:hypothetical protein
LVAADLADELEPVRHTRERRQRGRNRVFTDPDHARRSRGRGRVLAVVRAGNQRLGGQRIVGRELDPQARARNGANAARYDREVLCGLVLEDPELGVAVTLEGAVPVEMVRLEVEENRDPGTEFLDVLELEARELAHDPLIGLHLTDQLAQRGADVPGGPRAEHRAQQLGRGRLPVRAGDADDRILQVARSELDLTPDRRPALARRDNEGHLTGDARALDEHVDAFEQAEVGVVPERPVDGDHINPVRFERRLRRRPRAREAEHEHLRHCSRNWR